MWPPSRDSSHGSMAYEDMRARFARVAANPRTQLRLREAAKASERTCAKFNRSLTPEPEALDRRVTC